MGAVLLLVTACGAGEDLAADAGEGGCPDNTSTVALDVAPQVVARGDAVDITVRWIVDRALDERTRAELLLEADRIEVELPLAPEPEAPEPTYAGSMLNPFGFGAPPGLLTVVTSGYGPDCKNEVSAATQITLE